MTAKDWVSESVTKKSVIILELLRLTSLLRKAIEVNDQERADDCLDRRESLFAELQRLDQKLKGQPTPQDEEFLKMLNQLKAMDAELLDLGVKGRNMILQEVLHSSKLRIEILTQGMVDPKGNSLSVKV